MDWMEPRARYAAFAAAWLLVALSASPARGDDADRETYLREATDFTETTPWVGTGGAAGIQAQRKAFHEQYVANKQAFLAGKNTLDLVLEAERFLTAADRMRRAPNEDAAAIHLSVLRNERMLALVRERFAQGKCSRADLSQVVGQLRLVEMEANGGQGK